MNINTPFNLYWEHEGTVYEAYNYDDTTYGIKSSRGNLYLYSKTNIHNLINLGEVVLVKDPQMVTIPESEYHSLIEEINMLQELVAELSVPQDSALEQQAETYRALQMLLVAHPSFQDGAGENTTHLEELVNTVMELQAAWDRLASTPKKDVTDTTGFKPISEYTLADWELACKEDWVFECREGSTVRIMYTYPDGDYVSRGDDDLTRTVNGHWIVGETDSDDIVKRIK